MGRSLTAKLVYGYDLGGAEDEWKVREANEYGGLTLDWLDEDTDDVIGDMERRILAVVAGFTETWETSDDGKGFFRRKRAAEATLGVKFGSYGVSDYSAYLLSAHSVDVRGAEVMDLAALESHPDRPQWDAALTAAIQALGITPMQEKPGWLLCASYG